MLRTLVNTRLISISNANARNAEMRTVSILICWRPCFEQCSPSNIKQYEKELEDKIFSTIELGKQDYSSIMEMTPARLDRYLTWKSKLEEEKQKLMDSQTK